MKKNNSAKTILLKLLSFVPSLALLFLIFGFSSQDGESSGSLSFRISLFLVELFAPILPTALSEDMLYERAEFIHLFVRKAAHMMEYFLLALSLQLPLASCFSHRTGWRTRLGTGFLLTVCFAALDEYHQTFVPGRSGNLTDIGIDSIGAIAASLLLYIFFSIRQKRQTA
ncbi:MAG: VanZ family protein [Lachnospiraceae bacterium]|nr:VanZ family protein [Lachnospiraceae bacterium]